MSETPNGTEITTETDIDEPVVDVVVEVDVDPVSDDVVVEDDVDSVENDTAPEAADAEPDAEAPADIHVGPDLSGPVATTCESGGKSGWLDIPEASGAARFSDGMSIIVADSGNRGRALLLAADGTSTTITLPLDGPTHATGGHFTDDDLEGLDLGIDGRLYGLTSAGWLRIWTRDGNDFALVGASAPVSDNEVFACANRKVNCGPNYEGLCLRPTDIPAATGRAEPCVGYAASKTRGELVCLVRATEGAALRVDPDRVFATGFEPEHVSDCAFFTGADGRPRVLVAGNLLSGSLARIVVEDTLEHIPTDVSGAANQEALLERGPGQWWSLGDLQQYSDSSPWTDIRCTVAPVAAPR